MTYLRKRGIRDLAAMALSGTADVNDAGLVLSHSLSQLRLTIDTLARAIEGGGMDHGDLQANLIAIQHRCEALENFADDCLTVDFLPLDEGGADSPGECPQ